MNHCCYDWVGWWKQWKLCQVTIEPGPLWNGLVFLVSGVYWYYKYTKKFHKGRSEALVVYEVTDTYPGSTMVLTLGPRVDALDMTESAVSGLCVK